jgi:hypothetical protein
MRYVCLFTPLAEKRQNNLNINAFEVAKF